MLDLATERTMGRVSARLARMYREDDLDEHIGPPPEDDGFLRHDMDHHLFKQLNIDLRDTFLPDGMATDLKAICRIYEDTITRRGGIDLQ